MTFDPAVSQRCQSCPEGYFVVKNCSVKIERGVMKTEGVQCGPCTNCSAVDQLTLVGCSTFADSKCENRSSPAVTSSAAESPVAPSHLKIVAFVMAPLLLVVLFLLLLKLLVFRSHQHSKLKGADLL
ncbi:uncharacterized protein V6R79_017921 [Siganus canaliculatus]